MKVMNRRVLVVDPDWKGLQQAFEKISHVTIQACGSFEEFLSLIESFKPHLVAVHSHLPGYQSEEICKCIRGRGIEQEYVGLMLTVDDFEKKCPSEHLLSLADDFVVRSRSLKELRARVYAAFRLVDLALTLRENHLQILLGNERLSKASITDELTGLYNMRYFQKRFKQEFVRAKRYSKELSVLMFDVDRFKLVNDNNDHLLGSHILATIGQLVNQTIRSVDIPARFGGDEYVILLPETSLEGGVKFAERLRTKIKSEQFEGRDGPFSITVSMGVASFLENPEIKDVADLLREADNKLYDAKENGRDNVQY